MYELTCGRVFVRLKEDLSCLEYGREGQVYRTEAPFTFACAERAVSAQACRHKTVTLEGDTIRVALGGFVFAARFCGNDYCRPSPEFFPDLEITLTLRLDGEDLVIGASPIENIGVTPISVCLAQGLMTRPSDREGAFVLPVDYGTRFDLPRRDIFSHKMAPSAAWSLPVHGFFTPEGGLGMWCEDPDRDYLVTCNTGLERRFAVTCREIYHDMANAPRCVRWMLLAPGADFRALAARCRALRKASGRFKTIRDKQKDNPVAAELPGTVFWKHNVYYTARPEGVQKTWSLYVKQAGWNENEGFPGNWTAPEIFGTARARGFDRVAVCNTGWNRFGFDAGYPTRLPPNPERGTPEEFIAAAAHARQMSPGYFLNVHDNYIDAYQGDEFRPEEMLQTLPGTPQLGAVWRGGQARWLCSACSLKYAGRDLKRIRELTGPGCIYLDVFACIPLACCRSNAHPLTRRQDLENKRALCRLARKTFGALAVEGCGTDHYADLIDIGAYGGLHFSSFPPLSDGPVPVPVPLWQMVYHDSVLNYFGEGYSPVHGSEYRLYQALYTLLPTAFDEHAYRISFGLRSAFCAAMTDFEDIIPRRVTLDEDGSFRTHGLSRAAYADGTAVIANFDDEAHRVGGITIPSRDYVILFDGKEIT